MMKDSEIAKMGVLDLAEAYRRKELSPREAVQSLLREIKRKQVDYNLFIKITEEEALRSAAESEERMQKGSLLSPLDGIPFGIKDLIYTKGIHTTMGCDIYKDFVPDFNATVVERLVSGGAVAMGKLNTQQFAFGVTGDRSASGAARNPHNKQKVCGGSSSGSAGAVAAEILPLAIGTDTGGSIRIPASCCGVVGMKPTYGRVSIYGILPVCEGFDHAGPITRNVRDNAAALNSIAGYDANDYFSVNTPVCPDYGRRIGESIKGAVIGVPFSLFSNNIQRAVLAAVTDAIKALEKRGAVIKEIEFPGPEELAMYRKAHQTVLLGNAYTVHEKDIAESSELIAKDVLERLKTGNVPVTDFVRSLRLQPRFKEIFRKLMCNLDIIMMPTLSITATDIDAREVMIEGHKTPIYDPYTRFCWMSNFTGFPALSMPCGKEEGLPIGVQLIGAEWDEDNMYRFAAELEKSLA